MKNIMKLLLLISIMINIIGCGNTPVDEEEGTTPAPPITEEQRPMLLVLVNYENQQFISSESSWVERIFGDNKHQLNHYFDETSLSKFSFLQANERASTQNDGAISVFLTKNHPNSEASSQVHSDLKDALIITNKDIDYSEYDTNGDGHITPNELVLMFILAGEEDAYGSSFGSNSIWAHESCVDSENIPLLDGVTLMGCKNSGNYGVFGERHGSGTTSHDATIGIIAHELGHVVFDLPDLYDTLGRSAGIGYFGLMGGGTWANESLSELQSLPGNTPTHFCAYSKIKNRWIDAEVVSSKDDVKVLNGTGLNNFNIIKLPITSNEYFLVENRANEGYDKGLFMLTRNDSLGFQGGLAVWHIDESVIREKFDNNDVQGDKTHKGVDLEEAANAVLDKSSRAIGHDNNLYFSGNVAAFNNDTLPSSKSYSGDSTGITINNISVRSNVMEATFSN